MSASSSKQTTPKKSPRKREQALVIVESPTKAKTISKFLKEGYTVLSSYGHIRDLPRNAADVPEEVKGESWARLGINIEKGFEPLYVINTDKKKNIHQLKKALKEADTLYLATDDDREGEAIAWHLLQVLNPPKKKEVKRIVFHEITKSAIEHALQTPRTVNEQLVDAQEARRILDRLYGYEVSPVLWKKVLPKLSAGRVQSVATRIIVERERERMAFTSAAYWSIEGQFLAEQKKFTANLIQYDGKHIATGKHFTAQGTLKEDGSHIVLDESKTNTIIDQIKNTEGTVTAVESRPYRRRPAAPFITSTFQQEAGRKLGMSSAAAMRTAQSLYEQGYITYMRTDSTTLAESAVQEARRTIQTTFGEQFLPNEPRTYTKKSKNAQEAHEAIRPAGTTFQTPDEIRKVTNKTEADIYELIWKRTIASQMTDAEGNTVTLKIEVPTHQQSAVFSTSGTVITHQGFRQVYLEEEDESENTATEEQERELPALKKGDTTLLKEAIPEGHETQPPARYTEASLVKKLEELGVGRPSTYASIIKTILDREYIWKKSSALVPSLKAFSVIRLLEQHFPTLVDYDFTASMEDDLDRIASGKEERNPYLAAFYLGTETVQNQMVNLGLKDLINEKLGDIDAAAINSIPIGKNTKDEPIVARVGRYGPYVQRGEDTASIPEDLPPDELTVEKAEEFLNADTDGKILGKDEETGKDIIAKAGRFGPYIQVGEFEEDGEKPKTASLFSTMSLDTITLEDAKKLLSLPRTIGKDPETNEEIFAMNGRYGPYMKKGSDSRSLETEQQLFDITLEEAIEIYKQPKQRRGQQIKPPLKELGEDPVSKKPIVLKDGRFGPYVTDGETNASLRTGDSIEEITPQRAIELLQERREKGPAKKKRKKKRTKKKRTKKE